MKAPDGWELIGTGGNCTAWQLVLTVDKNKGAAAYALITQAGDPAAPERARDRCTLGVYGVEDRQLVGFEFPRLSDALHAARCLAFVEEVEI